jgi:hypothetical protein
MTEVLFLLSRTTAVVSALVKHIIRSWREHFARAVAMKFNCFFLMPFVDEFPFYLRQELDRVYEGDMGHLFDISELKQALKRRRDDLIAECKANQRLQDKFDVIDTQMRASKYALEDDDGEDEEPYLREDPEADAYFTLDPPPGQGQVMQDVDGPPSASAADGGFFGMPKRDRDRERERDRDRDRDSPSFADSLGPIGGPAPPAAAPGSGRGLGGGGKGGSGDDLFGSNRNMSLKDQKDGSKDSTEVRRGQRRRGPDLA